MQFDNMETEKTIAEYGVRGNLKTTGNAKPSSTKATTPGDPPPHVIVELDKPNVINGRPVTCLPHMPANYRY